MGYIAWIYGVLEETSGSSVDHAGGMCEAVLLIHLGHLEFGEFSIILFC